MKNLLLNSSSFKIMREENYLYVDKTKWIHRLLTTDSAYFLSRPRRFGKSLAISTLEQLFKGNEKLFKGLYIENKWNFTQYPIILFDFNEILNENTKILKEALLETLYDQAELYDVKIKSKLIANAFRQLITALYKKFNQKIVILIDEYDKPLIDHLGKGDQHIQIAKNNRDLLKGLFGIVKGKSVVDILKFTFVTGVSRFVKVSIFSEWNNLTDISTDEEFADFLGYTEKEISTNFNPYIEQLCRKSNLEIKVCLQKIKAYYNGYQFSPDNDLKVYNPISLMYALKTKRFKNYWFKTATPSFLIHLLKENNYYLPEIENIKVDEDFLDTFDIENLDIIPLLFQTGYLTITDYEEDDEIITLNYPNKEVKNSFSKRLLYDYYHPKTKIFFLAKKLAKTFKNEQFNEIQDLINEILSLIPYPIHNKNENYYHSLMYMIFSVLGLNAQSEVINSKGRLDMKITFPDKIFLIEFKANQNAKVALKQIKNKYLISYKSDPRHIYLCGINFNLKNREVDDVMVEKFK